METYNIALRERYSAEDDIRRYKQQPIPRRKESLRYGT